MSEEDLVSIEIDKLRPRLMSSIYSAVLFSSSMIVGAVIYAIGVIFFVPTEVLEATNWQVFPAFEHLSVILLVSLVMMPFVVLFQLITGFCLSKKRFVVECLGVLLSLLFCVFFFWPAIFI